VQIGAFDLVQEANPIIDEQFLEEVNLAARLSTAKASLHGGKDIEVVKRLASPEGVAELVSKGAKTFPTSATHIENSVEGPTSLQLAAKRMSTVIENNTSHEVVRGKSMVVVVAATFFRLGPVAQSIITCGVWSIGSGYLNALKNASFDKVAKVYKSAPMMYKSIECLNGDPNPLRKLVDDYVSSISAYLALTQAALTLSHPDELDKEKTTCIEQVNQAQPHLIAVQEELAIVKGKHKGAIERVVQLKEAPYIACEEEQKLRSDVGTKSTLVTTIKQQVIKKKQAFANLEAIPTLSQDEAEKLKGHERNVLEL